ncbi:MAG: DNA replication and repair protein RecF [Bdellovibrionales bacterium]|nr:DNA replication and repair protein RecF [Bdellovibrionales bacterium]
MKLHNLHIQNVRNINEVSIPCGRGIHFILGMNGQGKTSILESIYVLSNLRSFRDNDLHPLLRSGCSSSQIRGDFRIAEATRAELKVELVQGPKRFEKRAFINQKLSRSAVEYFGLKLNHSPIQFHAINLNPASTDLIRGEPAVRRTYLNQSISSESPEYLDILKHYQKSLDQKNALLKQDEKIDFKLLEILNENLALSGAKLILFRLTYLNRINQTFTGFLKKIAPAQTPVFAGYKSGETLYFNGHFEIPSLENLVENLNQKFIQKGSLERHRKTSVVGPHRDDLMFKVGTKVSPLLPDLVDVGSQGEIRSVLLALKLAELEEFERITGVRPVLLIDDFSSELDSSRRNFLLRYLKDSDLQIFVTSTDDLSQSLESSGTLIRMSQGRMC